jgi:hypothetical protein
VTNPGCAGLKPEEVVDREPREPREKRSPGDNSLVQAASPFACLVYFAVVRCTAGFRLKYFQRRQSLVLIGDIHRSGSGPVAGKARFPDGFCRLIPLPTPCPARFSSRTSFLTIRGIILERAVEGHAGDGLIGRAAVAGWIGIVLTAGNGSVLMNSHFPSLRIGEALATRQS